MTLIEIMVAILVLLIAVLGTSGIRYHTELNARKAEAQIAAARVGSLLCESWRGSKGSSAYDPVAGMSPNVNIATNSDGPAVESGYSALGNFKVIVDDQNFYTTLSWQDVSAGLRLLNVTITWDQRDYGKAEFADADKSVTLSTYVTL
jgi:Tfp pilus assembly protein PilV